MTIYSRDENEGHRGYFMKGLGTVGTGPHPAVTVTDAISDLPRESSKALLLHFITFEANSFSVRVPDVSSSPPTSLIIELTRSYLEEQKRPAGCASLLFLLTVGEGNPTSGSASQSQHRIDHCPRTIISGPSAEMQ